MKKLILLPAILATSAFVIFAACSSSTKESGYESSAVEDESAVISSSSTINLENFVTTTTVTAESVMPNMLSSEILSYEEICKEIDEYFRMYYAKNKNYSSDTIMSKELLCTVGVFITGYYDCDALVRLDTVSCGDFQTAFSQFYIINDRLIYKTTCKAEHRLKTEYFYEYFIIDGREFKYDREIGELVECPESGEFEIAQKELNTIWIEKF